MIPFADLIAHIRNPDRRRSYDPKCFDLAEHFLPNGTEDQKDELAQVIQCAIEDHLWEPSEQ